MQTLVIEDVEQTQEELQEPTCRHHWVIESPHGATSSGVCKRCHAVREFRNSSSDAIWEGDPMVSINKMGGSAKRPAVVAVSVDGND